MWHWGCWHYCIGFGVQGLGNNTADYNELVASLEARGLKAIVAQVSRLDWLRNAAGLLDANYWKGSLQPRPVLDWYLERTKNAIAAAKAMGQGAFHFPLFVPVNLFHSSNTQKLCRSNMAFVVQKIV
jgi:hypothetical protein